MIDCPLKSSNRGFQFNGDEEHIEDEEAYVECIEDAVVAEDKPWCHNGRVNPLMDSVRDQLNSEFLKFSNGEVLDDEDSCDYPESCITEYFASGDKDDCLSGGDATACSEKATIQVSIREISNIDWEFEFYQS